MQYKRSSQDQFYFKENWTGKLWTTLSVFTPEHGSVPGMREKYIFMYLYTNVKHNFQIAYF